MKTTLTLISAATLLAGLTSAQKLSYDITDLGTRPDLTMNLSPHITNNGAVSGQASRADGTEHAVIWQNGQLTDLGSPGLGGQNSIAWSVNESGTATGEAETATKDPNGEDFCGFAALGLPAKGSTCVPFIYRHGTMMPLPTLGGFNGQADAINSRGDAAGTAENFTRNWNCTAPQQYDFKPVLWQNGQVQELPTHPGDPEGIAFGVNDQGDVVGTSGPCAPFNPISQLYLTYAHPILWRNGVRVDLPTLDGGKGTFNGNSACAINNQGLIAGQLDAADGSTGYAVIWQDGKIVNLGTLPGDFASVSANLNDRGQVVGVSLDSSFHPRPFVWQNGVMSDLNALAGSNPAHLFLQLAEGINNSGQIVGIACVENAQGVCDQNSPIHAYLATPRGMTTAFAGPKNPAITGPSIQLDGTQSVSADGGPLTYSWTIPQGYPSVALSGGNTATPTVEFPVTKGTYMFQLTVTDSMGGVSVDSLKLNYF